MTKKNPNHSKKERITYPRTDLLGAFDPFIKEDYSSKREKDETKTTK